jgi:hypothetical protein
MLIAIDLHDESRIPAAEIRVVSTDRFLPHELVTAAAPVLKTEPEQFLLEGGLAAQCSGAACCGRRRWAHSGKLSAFGASINPLGNTTPSQVFNLLRSAPHLSSPRQSRGEERS